MRARLVPAAYSPDYSRIRVMVAQDIGLTRRFGIEAIASAIAE